MRSELAPEIEAQRIAGPAGAGCYGAFRVLCPHTGRRLQVIVSDGRDWSESGLFAPVWEHVSAVAPHGLLPGYAEMCWLKGVFFEDAECVVQFHVPAADHISIKQNCLHLWKVVGAAFPVPPKECV